MRIGIIITTYNSEETIIRCLDSLRLDELDHEIYLKIIVIDDASRDLTKKIISDYYSKGLISKAIFLLANKGVSAARNLGINECYDVDKILFLDSDDCLKINFLNEIIKKDISLDNFMVVGSHIETNNKNYSKLVKFFESDYFLSKDDNKLSNYLEQYLLQPNKYSLFSNSWGRIYDMKFINSNNKIRFNEKMNTFEDVDFNFRYLRKNPKIFYLDSLIYVNYIPSDDILSKSSKFGRNNKISKMFSFIWAMRSAKFFISNIPITNIEVKIDHCCGVFLVIQFIRVAGRVKSFKSFIDIYKNIKKILNHNICIRILQNYDSNKAKGNIFLAFLLKNRLYIFALLLGKYLFTKRYKYFIS